MSGRKAQSGRRAKAGKSDMLFTHAAENVAREVTSAGSEKARKAKPSTRLNKKGLVIYVPADVTKGLRRLAIDRDTTVQELGLLALSLLFEHCGLEAPAGLPALARAPVPAPTGAKGRHRTRVAARGTGAP